MTLISWYNRFSFLVRAPRQHFPDAGGSVSGREGRFRMNTFSLKDKVMVITGGTNGIDRGLVDYFTEQGDSLTDGSWTTVWLMADV